MSRFEEMVKIVAEDYREDCNEMNCTIKDLFKCWGFDKEDMVEEFRYILNDTKYANYVTDECEIFDDDDTIKTFRQFATAVKNYKI